MEINYTFYFLPFLRKMIKNYWHFVTGKQRSRYLISCGARLHPLILRNCGSLCLMMRWSWIWSGIRRQQCLSLSVIPMILSILWWRSCTHSFLICSVIKQMMSMVEDFRTMYDYCWMSSVISARFPNLINWSQRSEAVRSPLLLFYSRKAS